MDNDDYGLDFDTFAATLEVRLLDYMPHFRNFRWWDPPGGLGELDMLEVCCWYVSENYPIPVGTLRGYPKRSYDDAELLHWITCKVFEGELGVTTSQ